MYKFNEANAKQINLNLYKRVVRSKFTSFGCKTVYSQIDDGIAAEAIQMFGGQFLKAVV